MTTAMTPEAVRSARHGGLAGLLRDTGTVFARQMRPVWHRPFVIAFGMLQPLLYLVLFAPLLTGLSGAEGENPWQWFVPGLFVMLTLFTSGFAGFGLLPEMASGAHERMLVTPAGRVALLLGRVLRDLVIVSTQMLLILFLVLPFGFRTTLPGALAGFALLGVLATGLATLSYVVAMAVGRTYVFAPIVQTVMMPLLLLSGVLLPMESAPGWLYTLSRLNPVAHVVDAARVSFGGGTWDGTVLLGWVMAVGLTVAALAFGARSTRRLHG
ncbi:ABC transporter permease [Nocardiopsis alba]|uniref:ABC transporter permease n=1 Tax=Nocardiopsis alba TaxID=53437 RepID=UPI00381D8E0F